MSGVVTKFVTVLTITTISLSASAVSFTPIGDLPGGTFDSGALAISKDGRYIAGYGTTHGAYINGIGYTSIRTEAIYVDQCGMKNLAIGTLLPEGGTDNMATDISNSKYVVGVKGDLEKGNARAFKLYGSPDYVYRADIYSQSAAFGIAADTDEIIGVALGQSSLDGLIITDARTLNQTTQTLNSSYLYTLPLGISADGNIVVGGVTDDPERSFATKWHMPNNSYTHLPDLPGGNDYAEAWDISDNGNVIVGIGSSVNGTEAVLWRNGVAYGLGDLVGGSYFSGARAVSSDGRIVVGAATSNYGSQEAFIWDANNGMRSLRQVLIKSGLDLQNWQLNIATDISGDGRKITGIGTNPNGKSEGWMVDLTPFQPHGLSGDFNSDGRDDFLKRNSLTGENEIWLTDVSGFSRKHEFRKMHLNWSLVAINDFNNDGKDDLFWRNYKTGKNWLHILDGANLQMGMEIKSMPLRWVFAGSGDFNGDGYADIIWRNNITGLNWIHLRHSSEIIKSTKLNSMPLRWYLAAVGDFDADGKDDLIWRNRITGLNWVQLMDGSRIKEAKSFSKNPTSWGIAGVGDFDNNGHDDLFLRNKKTGVNWINLVHSDARILESKLVNKMTDQLWQVTHITDKDGDGKADVFMGNSCTNKGLVLLMDGAQIKNPQRN